MMGSDLDLSEGLEPERMLKADHFGQIVLAHSRGGDGILRKVIRRETHHAPLWTRWLALLLLRREERALRHLRDLEGIPSLLNMERGQLTRAWLPGSPLQEAPPSDPQWFLDARRLLAQCHRRGVVHNDAAKEPNWLVLEDGGAGLVDFQLASVHLRRGRSFRTRRREDLRHLLKHKRTYFPHLLSARELKILSRPSWGSRAWRRWVKPTYHFVTRRVFGWEDREGAGDRFRIKGES